MLTVFFYSIYSDKKIISAIVVDNSANRLLVQNVLSNRPQSIFVIQLNKHVDNIDKGDIIFIEYSGQIAESYPAKLLGVTQIDTLESYFQFNHVYEVKKYEEKNYF